MGRPAFTPEQRIISHRANSVRYAAANRERVNAYAKEHYRINGDAIRLKRKERRDRLKAEREAHPDFIPKVKKQPKAPKEPKSNPPLETVSVPPPILVEES